MRTTEKQKKFIEKTLNKFISKPLIKWDRFFYDPQKKLLSVYGWITKEDCYYKDYVQFDFQFKRILTSFRNPNIIFVTTTSAKYSLIIIKKLYGKNAKHNSCIRVNNFFNILNKQEVQNG